MADDATRQRYSLDDLLKVMARLRDPESGCPWDVEQDFRSIAPYTIEEAYEVADAIEQGDMAQLKEELGDLLLQVVYHAQMASEEDHFAFGDVADAITAKMIRRHPHVFEDPSRRAEFMTTDLWDQIKADEKKAAAGADAPAPSLLDGVPVGMPGLTRAAKLQGRAAKVGFDWSDIEPLLGKVDEELDELKEAISESEPQERIVEEFGDVVFVMANVARYLGFDPETALHRTSYKFTRRFRHIERALAAQGRTADEATLEEMDALWNAAKAAEKAGDGERERDE